LLADDLVLDLGGGPSWKDLMEKFPQEQIRCIDFNYDIVDGIPAENLIFRNIDKHGIPLHDNSCIYVRARDFLEHLRDFQFVINEVYRVLKHGGIFDIKCPSGASLAAWGNPDHVRIINTYTIEHIAEPIPNTNIFSKFEILENWDDGCMLVAKLKAIKEGVDMPVKGSVVGGVGIR
jgi:SAM-dependent methyltransferase